MNRALARFIGDVFDIVADNILLLGIVGVVCFLFGPSLLVLLERKERLPRLFVWVYGFVLAPIITLVLVFVANPQSYCNDPLPHEAFRLFYPLVLPLLPLYIHYFRAKQLNHPVLLGLILVMLSLGVFSITLGNEIFHLAYQSVQGHGVVYSGARAWECAYLNSASERSARSTVGSATLVFLVVQVLV
ncbi:MAG: hypothetical protein VXY68_08285, partial [Candidatus Thermoplasmatota archaeon]|nr:hypothetical protein [Candidatus Thermoplasmatota archaeon]